MLAFLVHHELSGAALDFATKLLVFICCEAILAKMSNCLGFLTNFVLAFVQSRIFEVLDSVSLSLCDVKGECTTTTFFSADETDQIDVFLTVFTIDLFVQDFFMVGIEEELLGADRAISNSKIFLLVGLNLTLRAKEVPVGILVTYY
jgi:hypothetical protein